MAARTGQPPATFAHTHVEYPTSVISPWTSVARRWLSLDRYRWRRYLVEGQRVSVAFSEQGGRWSFMAKPNVAYRSEPAFETPPNAVDAEGRPIFIAPHAAPLSPGIDRLFVAEPTRNGQKGRPKVRLDVNAKDWLGDRYTSQRFNFVRVHRHPMVVQPGRTIHYGHGGEPFFVARAAYGVPSGHHYFYALGNAVIDGMAAYVSPWFGVGSAGIQLHFAARCNALDELGRAVFLAPALARMNDGDWLFAHPCTAEFTPRWFEQHEHTIPAGAFELPSISKLTARDALAPYDWVGWRP